jgi:NADH:ubiquinone oxidoreductase subunit E
MTPAPTDDEIVSLLKEVYRGDSLSYKAIGHILGIPPKDVQAVAQRHGLTHRPKAGNRRDPARTRPPLPPVDPVPILALLNDPRGYSYKAVASMLSVPRARVREVAERHGLTGRQKVAGAAGGPAVRGRWLPPTKAGPVYLPWIQRALAAGQTVEAIALAIGKPTATVRGWIEFYDIAVPTPGLPPALDSISLLKEGRRLAKISKLVERMTRLDASAAADRQRAAK